MMFNMDLYENEQKFNEVAYKLIYYNEELSNPDLEEKEVSMRGKATAKVIEIARKYHFPLSKNQKHILTCYRVRKTQAREKRRQVEFLSTFDSKSSEAYQMIKRAANGGNVSFTLLQQFVNKVVDEENQYGGNKNFRCPREAKRNQDCMFKFIQENLEIFKKYIDAGCCFYVTLPQNLAIYHVIYV